MLLLSNTVGRVERGILVLAGSPTMDGSIHAEPAPEPLHKGPQP